MSDDEFEDRPDRKSGAMLTRRSFSIDPRFESAAATPPGPDSRRDLFERAQRPGTALAGQYRRRTDGLFKCSVIRVSLTASGVSDEFTSHGQHHHASL